MFVSQSFGLTATAVLLAASSEALPPAAALAWGALAGVAALCGLVFFYRALSGGTMALVAPLAGVIGAAVPAAIAIAGGEQLSPLRLAGLPVALLAIVLIALTRGVAGSRTDMRLRPVDLATAVLAGLGFAAFFLCLDAAASAGGQTWWPLLAVRLVGVVLVLLALPLLTMLARGTLRQRLAAVAGLRDPAGRRPAGRLIMLVPLFAGAALGDLGGNVFFLLANLHDLLSVAVVLSSLYPAVTALLATVLLGERLTRPQLAGVALAVLAAALIGAG